MIESNGSNEPHYSEADFRWTEPEENESTGRKPCYDIPCPVGVQPIVRPSDDDDALQRRFDSETLEHYIDTDRQQGLREWLDELLDYPAFDIRRHRMGQFMRLLYATSPVVTLGFEYASNSLHIQLNNGNIENDAEYRPPYNDDDDDDDDELFPEGMRDVLVRQKWEEESVALWNAMTIPERRVCWARWHGSQLPTTEDCRMIYGEDL